MAQRSSLGLLESLPANLRRRTASGLRPLLPHRTAHALAVDNLGAEDEADASASPQQPEAGPSRWFDKPPEAARSTRSPKLRGILRQLPPTDRQAVAKIHELVNVPNDSHIQKTLNKDLWWNYNLLSPAAKAVLPTVLMKRILRKVSPDGQDREISLKSEYPGPSPKAQADRALVILHDLKLAVLRERDEGRTPDVGTEEYHFVMAKFAAIGRVTRVERIVEDMREMGIPLKHRTQEIRLLALSRWVNQQSLEHDKRKTGLDFIRGDRYSQFKEKEPYIPPAYASTINRIIEELLGEPDSSFRSRTLDLVLRLAKESGNDEAYSSLLRHGYGLDTRLIGLEPPLGTLFDQRKGQQDKFARDLEGILKRTSSPEAHSPATSMLSTHALNTILTDLALKGDFMRMTVVYEYLASPDADSPTAQDLLHSLAEDREARARIRSQMPEDSPVLLQNPPVKSTHNVDEEPHTLTEAIEAEARRGQTLGFFGQRKGGGQGSALATLPSEPYVPFESFLQPSPSVFSIEAGVRRLDDLSPILNDLDNTGWSAANATSFSLLMRGCLNAAWRADEEGDVALAETAALQALHHLRCAAREDAARRSIFMLRWLAIREESQRRLTALDREYSQDTGKHQRAKNDILRWRTAMRSRVVYPATLLKNADFDMLLRLRLRCASLGRLRPMLRLKIEGELTSVLADLKKEYLVFTGHAWSDRREARKFKRAAQAESAEEFAAEAEIIQNELGHVTAQEAAPDTAIEVSSTVSKRIKGPFPAADSKLSNTFFSTRPHIPLTVPPEKRPTPVPFSLTSHLAMLSQSIKELTELKGQQEWKPTPMRR